MTCARDNHRPMDWERNPVWSDRRLRGHAALAQRVSDDAERSTSGADLGLIERPRSDLGGVRQPAAERAAKAKSVLLPLPPIPLSPAGHGPGMASVLPDAARVQGGLIRLASRKVRRWPPQRLPTSLA